jgi:antitoxin YefM
MSMIKVVVLAANPHETDFLRLDREINDIQSGLKQYGRYRDRFTFVPHLCTSTGDLRRFLLNEESLKAAFQNKEIEIVVYESDETDFLLQHPANKKRLLTAVENIQNHTNLVELNWESIS